MDRRMGNHPASHVTPVTKVARVTEHEISNVSVTPTTSAVSDLENGDVSLSDGEAEAAVTVLSSLTVRSSTTPVLPHPAAIAETAMNEGKQASTKSSPSPLPPVEELLRDIRNRFLLCAVCCHSMDEELRSPRRLACSHAACNSCTRGTEADSQPQCLLCQREGKTKAEETEKERKTTPDLTRLKMLELIQHCEAQRDPPESARSSVWFLESLVEELLTCGICQSLMEGPDRGACLLPCSHRLCVTCLTRLAPHSSSGRCHECRQIFNVQESSKDGVLETLLHWVMTFKEHVACLTSQPDDVSAHMYSLQELLAAKEQEVNENIQQQQLMRLVAVTLQETHARHSWSLPGLAGWRELAETCLTIVQETQSLGLQSSKDVWSTAKLAYNKLLSYSADRPDFVKALAAAGAVDVLTGICGYQPFVDSMTSEQVIHALKCSLATLLNVCCEDIPDVKQMFFKNRTAEVVTGLVRVEHTEGAVTYYALRLLRKMFFTLESDRRRLSDILDQEGLPEKCVQVLRSIHEKGFEASAIVWETAKMSYNIMHNYSLGENFSKSLARTGAVALMTRTCTMRKYLDEITNEDYNYAIEASISALFNIALEDGVEGYFRESKTFEVVCDLVREDYVDRGVCSGALSLLAKLFEKQSDHRAELGDCAARKGLPESLVSIAEARTKTIPRGGGSGFRFLQQTYSHMWNFSGCSTAFAKALAERGAVKLLTDNCSHQPFLDDLHSELTAYVVRASVAIIHNVWSRAGFQNEAQDTQAVQALCRLVTVENATNSLAGFVLAVLQLLYSNYRPARAAVGNSMAGEGMAERLVTLLKSFGEWLPLNKETIALRESAYNIMWNYSDASDVMAKDLARTGAVEFLTENLRPRLSLKEAKDEATANTLKSSVAILQNVARRIGTRQYFVESKTAEVLLPFVTGDDDVIWRLAAYSAVAFMVDAQDSCLVTDGDLIRQLRKLLEEAMDSPIRRAEGFATVEILQYIAQLALNDKVRSQFLENDVMPLLGRLVEDGDSDETAAALLCKERLEGEITND